MINHHSAQHTTAHFLIEGTVKARPSIGISAVLRCALCGPQRTTAHSGPRGRALCIAKPDWAATGPGQNLPKSHIEFTDGATWFGRRPA